MILDIDLTGIVADGKINGYDISVYLAAMEGEKVRLRLELVADTSEDRQ